MVIAKPSFGDKITGQYKFNIMVVSVSKNKYGHLLIVMIIMLFITIQSVVAQKIPNTSPDSEKITINDSLLPNLVIKVASYTAKIDHIDFLVRQQFNITPIALALPGIEKKVKGFKLRLEKSGSKMNLHEVMQK